MKFYLSNLFVLSPLLAIFSTTVMLYVSMATPIGPWIAPTLVLIGMLLCWVVPRKEPKTSLVCSTVGGSIGGILATACGFTFATLYFLDSALFGQWLSSPFYFMSMVSLLAFAAGWYGMWIANITESVFINNGDAHDVLAFPVSQMLNKMIIAHQQIRRAIELAIGFVVTTVFCVIQNGLSATKGLIPKTIVVCQPFVYRCFSFPLIGFDLWPMLWAIGFITGHTIALPLLVGAVIKLVCVQPMHSVWFFHMRFMDVLLAFCSGIVVSGAIQGVITLCKKGVGSSEGKPLLQLAQINRSRWVLIEGLCIICLIVPLLSYLGFSLIMQSYLLLFSFICAYQIVLIAGKIGLAQLGRFATFVLVPALFIFKLNAIQITVISLFVEVVAGVTVDVLFGRKLMQLRQVDRKQGMLFQYVGLLISSLVVGVIMWLLITRLGLGSSELFAQRAQARALLVHVKQFNYFVVLIGVCCGLLLKRLRFSPMLVLGGLLMPFNIMFGLVAGGLMTLCIKDRDRWYPFWSGVFAANSMWMLIRASFF